MTVYVLIAVTSSTATSNNFSISVHATENGADLENYRFFRGQGVVYPRELLP